MEIFGVADGSRLSPRGLVARNLGGGTDDGRRAFGREDAREVAQRATSHGDSEPRTRSTRYLPNRKICRRRRIFRPFVG
jgi:hypothetical protein